MTSTRRRFFFGSLAAAAGERAGYGRSRRKVLVVLIDGFDPEYLRLSHMPNLSRMGRNGIFKIGHGALTCQKLAR